MFTDLNLQLLAEAEAEATNAGADGGAEKAGQANGSQDAGINMEEADRIAQARSERAARAAVNSYFKQQGLSEQEAQQAFEAYKAQKAKQEEADRNNLTALQQKLAGYEQRESQAMQLANKRLVRAEAMVQAMSLNIRADRVEHAIRLADLSQIEVDENGHPDEAAIQDALKRVTQEIPELLTNGASDDNRAGFKLGGPGQNKQTSANEALAKIFGNTK